MNCGVISETIESFCGLNYLHHKALALFVAMEYARVPRTARIHPAILSHECRVLSMTEDKAITTTLFRQFPIL